MEKLPACSYVMQRRCPAHKEEFADLEFTGFSLNTIPTPAMRNTATSDEVLSEGFGRAASDQRWLSLYTWHNIFSHVMADAPKLSGSLRDG